MSDLFAQLAIERRFQSLSLSRTAAFASFNAVYLGAFNCWKLNTLYSHMFGNVLTASSISCKVLFDMLVCAPFLYFPLYFVVKAVFSGGQLRTSLRQYASRDGFKMLRKFWAVWLPVETIMWLLCPPHLRIAFLSAVSLLWQVFLSTKSYNPSSSSGGGDRTTGSSSHSSGAAVEAKGCGAAAAARATQVYMSNAGLRHPTFKL